MARPLMPIFDAFGGLFTKGESTTRVPGTATVCTNMRVGRDGKTLRKMHGGTRWTSSQVNGSDPVLGIAQFQDKQGVVHEIARTPNGYFERSFNDGTWSLLGSALNQEDDGIPMFASTQGVLHVVDGYSAYTYDGLTWSTWERLTAPQNGLIGIDSTDTKGVTYRPAVSLGSTGNNALAADSEYECFFTFAHQTDVTNESPPSEILRFKTTATKKAVTLYTGYSGRDSATLPDTTTSRHHLPTNVALLGTNAYLHAYVSAANTPGAWYRTATKLIADEAAEQSITIDAESTSNQFTDFYGPPRYATGIISHHSRLWTWGSPGYPTRIWFTELDTAGTFKGENFIDIGVDEPDDPVRACVAFGSGGGAELLILKLNSVWKMSGTTFTTFMAQRLIPGPSCMSDRAAVAASDGAVYWAGYEGAYRVSQGQVESISDEKIKDDWRSTTGLVSVA